MRAKFRQLTGPLAGWILTREVDMKFRDIFVPRIANSNPEIRKKAIAKETDQALLKRVIENDEDPEVKQKATARLEELTGVTA